MCQMSSTARAMRNREERYSKYAPAVALQSSCSKEKVKNSSLPGFYCHSLIYFIGANWAVLNAWMGHGSLAGKGPLWISCPLASCWDPNL